MKPNCPNTQCECFQKNDFVKKDGKFLRGEDQKSIQRFQCNQCKKKFSTSTLENEIFQKKRKINHTILTLLSSGVSQRRIALALRVNRKTVIKKFLFLAQLAKNHHNEFLNSMEKNSLEFIQFDDLITSIHTRLKPVSISVVVDANKRTILGAKVCEIPAFGKIAKISVKKYGPRKNEHRQNLHKLLEPLAPLVHSNAVIKTDKHKLYPKPIKKHFPKAVHMTYKGLKASVVGLGELKTKQFDPLFTINHTLAMLRANINRLFRKTWCTSKKQDRLQCHVELFISFYNQSLLSHPAK